MTDIRLRCRLLLCIGLSSTAILPGASLAQAPDAWVPFECEDSAPHPAWEAARPTSAEPILESDDEVIRAFEVGFRRRLFGSWWEGILYDLVSSTADALGLEDPVPTPWHDYRLGVIYDAIESGAMGYRVERVVSWAPSRCGGAPDQKGAFHLEAAWDGRRLSALLSMTGRLRSWGGGSHEEHGPLVRIRLPTLEEAAATMAAEAGGPVERAQYVLAHGYPHCSGVPCIAAVRGETLYLMELNGRLFAFGLEPRPEEEVLPPPPERCIGAPCAGYPYVLGVGDRWLAGELVHDSFSAR